MPVEFALRICLSPPPPLHRLLAGYEELRNTGPGKALRPCLQHRAPGLEAAVQKAAKKRVVFADSVGLMLTAVRLFSKVDEDSCELQLALAKLRTLSPRALAPASAYTLDFRPPASDYLDFRSRLQQNQVCLEHCLIQDTILTGTVQVRNVAYEKKVQVRITFDLWRSFQDFPCCYLRPSYGCTGTDAFSFHVPLPADPSPRDSAHFCISFQCDKGLYWDNNKGQNYPIQLAVDQGLPGWTTWDNLGPYW
ncbi:protein phosphatase 1 regulatory subunit 3C-B-like [Rhinatrema bivittatum]|uniref:protein phosphatase 1 regulatory subunit 3C-B-like n=1 Tax=Rhinatrema bivittatum TaxID=194408 RepID=UPI00112EBAFD|nr:protein phosphatase 1 regulatory subunit 3C-B-like [Rhinatrema bivittatum]